MSTSQDTSVQFLAIQNNNNHWSITTQALPEKTLQALPKAVTASAELSTRENHYTLLYSATTQTLSVFGNDTTEYLVAVAAIKMPNPLDILNVFYLGGMPYLVTYANDGKYLNFYRYNSDHTVSALHNLYVGEGLTMVKALPYRDISFLVAYNGTTGDCTKYQISLPPYDGLSVLETWSASWAKTWGHFNFFQFGGENFFLKANQDHKKVNIDHFMDDPDEGSHPVLSQDATSAMLNAQAISIYQGSEGQAYFLVYQSSGNLTLSSIYPNCLGWWELTNTSVAGSGQTLQPILVNDQPFLLIFS